MLGFIKGLFGLKGQSDASVTEETKPAAEVSSAKKQVAKVQPKTAKVVTSTSATNSQEFFLDADAAKTLGDINYMRTPKTIKRSFPKTVSATKGAKMVIQVSAMEMSDAIKAAAATEAEPQVNVVSERRQADTSLDMFRTMARDLKKR